MAKLLSILSGERQNASQQEGVTTRNESSWFRSPRFDKSTHRAADAEQDRGEENGDASGQCDASSFINITEAHAMPEEDAASKIDVAKRAAREHLLARRRILALRAERGSGSSTRNEGGTWLLHRIRGGGGDSSGAKIDTSTSSIVSHNDDDDDEVAPMPLDRGAYYDGGPRQRRIQGLLDQQVMQAGSSKESGMQATGSSRGDAQSNIAPQDPDKPKDDDKAKVEEEIEEEEESALSTAFLVSYFVAGGAAGAASRTVVSPLERLKIIMQVQPKSASNAGKGAYSGVIAGLHKMWVEEGFKGYMRGNGINCLRIAPYSAVQFSTYEILKSFMTDEQGELDTTRRLAAGALAGIASVVSTYPLDLVRSRISIASASMYAEAKQKVASTEGPSATQETTKRKPTREEVRRIIEERQKRIPGIARMTAKVYREEGGIRALYKGCVPTSLGVAPYVGINFAAYEALRKRLANEEGEISTLRKLMCGALAGSISQTLTYPLDVLRRRMQVSGMKDSKLGYSDKSSWGAIRTIVTAEGFFGLYRGIVPNLLKVAPSIGTSFAVYEFVQNFMHPPNPHHHHHHHQQQQQGQGQGQTKCATTHH